VYCIFIFLDVDCRCHHSEQEDEGRQQLSKEHTEEEHSFLPFYCEVHWLVRIAGFRGWVFQHNALHVIPLGGHLSKFGWK
jgi:hypothetical protein